MFTAPPDIKNPNFEIATKRLLHQLIKTLVVLLLCCVCKCVLTAISSGLDIPEIPGCHLLQQISLYGGSPKLFQGSVSLELTTYQFLPLFDSLK